MACKVPGKHFRKGLSPGGIIRMFPDDGMVRAWIGDLHRPDGPGCPDGGSDCPMLSGPAEAGGRRWTAGESIVVGERAGA